MGTDHLGRDLLSRLVRGARLSVLVGVSATLVAAVVGTLLGLAAGFFGRIADTLLMRGIDILMAFPYLLLATTLGWVVLEIAGLSFLGLGAQPPEADLGGMLGEGRDLLAIHPAWNGSPI